MWAGRTAAVRGSGIGPAVHAAAAAARGAGTPDLR